MALLNVSMLETTERKVLRLSMSYTPTRRSTNDLNQKTDFIQRQNFSNCAGLVAVNQTFKQGSKRNTLSFRITSKT